MGNHSNGVMIALLPTDPTWCHIELPHLTLVYAGKADELDPTKYNELGKDAFTLARTWPRQTLDVLSIETFGDEDEKVDVLRLKETPDLLKMRKVVEHWNASVHPFNPHATIGPVGSATGELPSRLIFDRVYVCWGETGFSIKLKHSY